MKLFAALATLATLSSFATKVQAQAIIFEEEVVSRKIVLMPGGMEIKHGEVIIGGPLRTYSKGKVSIGSRIITRDMFSATLVAMNVSQNTLISDDTYYGKRTTTLDKIAVTSGCVGAFCVGDKVITRDRMSGTVEGYFNDGELVVNDTYYGKRRHTQNSLAITDGCSGMFCVGDTVITRDRITGKVKGFYGNGKLVVDDSYYGKRSHEADDLSVTQGVCANIFVQRVKFC